MQKERLLEQLGIRAIEAKVYLYLLKSKRGTVLEIAKTTGISRTNVYHSSVRLKEMGLVGEVIEGKRRYMVPESPERLVSTLRLKEGIARHVATILLDDFKTEKYEAKIKFFEGREGVKKLAYQTLENKEKVLRSLGDYRTLNESFPIRMRRHFVAERAKRKITTRLLDMQDNRLLYLTNREFSTIANIRQWRELRLLPKGIHLNFFIMTYDDKVLFFAPAKEGYSFSFQSPSFAETVKSIFDFLWNISEPLK